MKYTDEAIEHWKKNLKKEDILDQSNDVGFSKVIDANKAIHYYKGLGGDCADENVKRLLEFWDKGYNDCCLEILIFYRSKKSLLHIQIYDKKNDRVIDVSNGEQKMWKRKEWLEMGASGVEFTFLISKKRFKGLCEAWKMAGCKELSDSDSLKCICNIHVDELKNKIKYPFTWGTYSITKE